MAQGNREVEKLEEVRIPRTLFQEQKPIRETALHVFCDASQDPYGACTYVTIGFRPQTGKLNLRGRHNNNWGK